MVSAVSGVSSLLPFLDEPLGSAGQGSPTQPFPFQQFLDQAVDALNRVSGVEMASDNTLQQYLQGNVSLEDAVFAMNELTTTIQLANQALTNAIGAFRELEQMQI